jgi:hypothetical protein
MGHVFGGCHLTVCSQCTSVLRPWAKAEAAQVKYDAGLIKTFNRQA